MLIRQQKSELGPQEDGKIRKCIGCNMMRDHIKQLTEEMSHLNDRLESARDQVMSLLLEQRNSAAYGGEDESPLIRRKK